MRVKILVVLCRSGNSSMLRCSWTGAMRAQASGGEGTFMLWHGTDNWAKCECALKTKKGSFKFLIRLMEK